MKHVKRVRYELRAIDKAVVAVLGLVHALSGMYLIGPWYLESTENGNVAALLHLFDSEIAVVIYGLLIIIDGLFLLWAALNGGRFLKNALLAGFLLRLYSLIGVFLTIDSWRPPSYLSHIATVLIAGSMWVWVRVNERTP